MNGEAPVSNWCSSSNQVPSTLVRHSNDASSSMPTKLQFLNHGKHNKHHVHRDNRNHSCQPQGRQPISVLKNEIDEFQLATLITTNSINCFGIQSANKITVLQQQSFLIYYDKQIYYFLKTNTVPKTVARGNQNTP